MEWRSVGDWAVSQCYELKGLRVFTWHRFPTDGPIKPEIGPTGQIGKFGPIPKNRKTGKPEIPIFWTIRAGSVTGARSFHP